VTFADVLVEEIYLVLAEEESTEVGDAAAKI
jgi:hypothetical protein